MGEEGTEREGGIEGHRERRDRGRETERDREKRERQLDHPKINTSKCDLNDLIVHTV